MTKTKTHRNATQPTVTTRPLSETEMLATSGGYYRESPEGRSHPRNDQNFGH
jgi:hypothetical protein